MRRKKFVYSFTCLNNMIDKGCLNDRIKELSPVDKFTLVNVTASNRNVMFSYVLLTLKDELPSEFELSGLDRNFEGIYRLPLLSFISYADQFLGKFLYDNDIKIVRF